MPIEIGGKKYELYFSTEAYLELSRKHGGIKEFSDKLKEMTPDEITIACVSLTTLLINQKILIDNEEKGTNEPLITDQKLLLYLTPAMQIEARSKLFQAIGLGMGRELRVDAPGQKDEDLVLGEMNEEKNAESAADKK